MRRTLPIWALAATLMFTSLAAEARPKHKKPHHPRWNQRQHYFQHQQGNCNWQRQRDRQWNWNNGNVYRYNTFDPWAGSPNARNWNNPGTNWNPDGSWNPHGYVNPNCPK